MCDPIVSDRLVDPALEITVAHFKKIISLQRASRGNPMTYKNAEDLTANLHIGRSVRHGSTIGFARHRSYGRTATVDKIAQPMNLPLGCRPPLRAMGRCVWQKQRPLQRQPSVWGRGVSAVPGRKPLIGLHHRLKLRFAKRNQGFGGSASVTKVAVNFKIGVQRVGLNLCKSGLGAAYRAGV